MMRISLLLVFLILFSFVVSGQEMTITEFQEFPMDMDAKLNYPKKNPNDGELYAIIKVQTSLKCEDFSLFDFGSVGNGDIDCSNGLWIYAPATATKLSINHRLAGTIVNHLLPMQLKPATVYKMVIASGRQISRIEETLNSGYLAVKSNVSGSLLKVMQDGKEMVSEYIADEGNTITLAIGQYTYTVEAVDYETERGVFVIKNEDRYNLNANLRSSMGSLSVNSSPEQGAYVNINGKRQEKTTPAVFPLRKGNYQITVYKDLYKQAESTVTVSAGEQAVYNAVLSANFAEVAIDAPAGAYVYIDGNQSGEGKWAGRLKAGMHTIEVEKASHTSFKTTVTLTNGEKKLVSVPPLTPIYGKLNVITTPMDARVVVDGVEYGSKTPCVVKDVLVGDRKVRLVPASSEYETFETTVNISEGKITNLNKTFTKKPKTVAAATTVNKTSATCGSDFTDSRDNQVYPTVRIGSQCWMSKNLNYGSRVSGDDYDTHKRSGVQKICYKNSESNCNKYGGLYSWNETVNGDKSGSIKYVSGSSKVIQGICPDGWHVPSDEEFKTLEKYLGMSSSEADDKWSMEKWGRGTDEGRKLKSRDYWDEYDSSTSGTNSSGWDGRPGGYRHSSGGTF
ncbi:MAG: PEGA domain-containing protein, partial [Culturomica sp.]|nr:PEGA domain-containing protein [Culturomica sp.]